MQAEQRDRVLTVALGLAAAQITDCSASSRHVEYDANTSLQRLETMINSSSATFSLPVLTLEHCDTTRTYSSCCCCCTSSLVQSMAKPHQTSIKAGQLKREPLPLVSSVRCLDTLLTWSETRTGTLRCSGNCCCCGNVTCRG